MAEPLRIEFEWLTREAGSERDRAFAADLTVAVGDQYLTRLDDLLAKTVRNHMRGSAWSLATWLAANWWRLRWEPAAGAWLGDANWRLAHSMAAAGGGYVWPDVVFASDGEDVEIALRSTASSARFEPVRYLAQIETHVRATDFEQAIDQFMAGVLGRSGAFRVEDDCLGTLWQEILSERRHPKTRKRRKVEAMAGYDPDDAPDEVIKQLIQDKEHLGKDALEEVAAGARHGTGDVLAWLREISRADGAPSARGFRGSLPEAVAPAAASPKGGAPWQRATQLARAVREQWGLGNKPIRNTKLAEIVGAKPSVFTDQLAIKAPLQIALRSKAKDAFDFYFDRAVPTTRRFTVSRLLGDYLDSGGGERLHPATGAKTARQKFQRAFAQEFLRPLDGLMEMLSTEKPEVADIEAAAAYFHVSPLMVRTTLVNKGKLRREALDWED